MPVPANNQTTDFLIKEYESLRTEMNEAVKETRTIERHAVIAIGIIWSWLALTENAPYRQLIWLPLIIVLFSAYRAYGLTAHIDTIAKYLTKIESFFITLDDDLGFELNHSAALTAKRFSAYIFWILLCAMTIIVPAIFYRG